MVAFCNSYFATRITPLLSAIQMSYVTAVCSTIKATQSATVLKPVCTTLLTPDFATHLSALI